jgi:PAS domain S-box-containing protein
MSKGSACKEAKNQTTETNSFMFIDSSALGKKDTLHILHVDDDVCLLEVSKQILLMENNFEIENVSSVDEAFQKMEQQTYDAIVSDYEMPQKNGLEFLKEVREQKNDITFILFTGKGREDVAVTALNLGADSYINKNGSPETVYCELADAINKTVERKKSRKLLAASESKYRMLVEKSLQGILVTKAAPLRLVFANEAMGKILGYSPQELLSLSPEGILGLVHHEDRAVFFKRMENRLRGEKMEACFEFRAERKDGSTIWLSALANRVDYDDQPAVLGMFLDVNESKNAREILAESEDRYRELANCLPDIVFETDINGQVLFANEGAYRLSGYSQGELEAGANILQFLVPADREKAMKSIQRLLSGGSYVPNEYTFMRKDGTTFPALIIATPRFYKNRMVGLRGLAIDMSERKKAEEMLRVSENRYRTLFAGIREGFALCEIITDTMGRPCDYRILEINDAYEKQTGFKREFIKGKRVRDFFPDVESSWIEILGKVALTGESNHFEYYNRNIDKFFDVFAFSPKKGKFVVLLVDNTQHKKTKDSLEKEQQELNLIIDSSPIIIFYKDKNGKFIRVNQAFAEAQKISKEKFLGKTVFDFFSSEIARGMAKDDLEVLESGQPRLGIIEQYESARGKRWVQTDKVPTFDRNGIANGLVGFAQDITERKKAEENLNRLMDELVKVNEKLNVVGSLTRHDVRNKLSAVTGYAYLLKKKHTDKKDIMDGLSKMEQAVAESVKIFEFAKMYEQIGVEELTYINVEGTFKEALALFSGSFNVKVINDCRGLSLLADSFLRQLFFNLIDNSLKHGKKATTIKVSYEKADQDRMRLIYEDDGVGVPVDVKMKLFKSGFSTGGSSGYGLYLIRRMIEVYGWDIQENGEPDKGAKFTITIPRINQKGKENFRST